MKTEVMATLEEGVFLPLEPVNWKAHSRVRVILDVPAESQDAETNAGWEAMKQLIKDRPIHAGGLRFTRDELNDRD